MHEFIEEYGGVIAATFIVLIILGLLFNMLSQSGGLHELAIKAFESIGAKEI